MWIKITTEEAKRYYQDGIKVYYALENKQGRLLQRSMFGIDTTATVDGLIHLIDGADVYKLVKLLYSREKPWS